MYELIVPPHDCTLLWAPVQRLRSMCLLGKVPDTRLPGVLKATMFLLDAFEQHARSELLIYVVSLVALGLSVTFSLGTSNPVARSTVVYHGPRFCLLLRKLSPDPGYADTPSRPNCSLVFPVPDAFHLCSALCTV
jgi:hypothetical protein